MTASPDSSQLFGQCITYPDIGSSARLARLVGLDDQKARLQKTLGLLINPDGFKTWANSHHSGAEKILDIVLERPPLVILEGDVGAGKTELAETIGDAIARQEGVNITLFPLSLATRGQGLVGEMTRLLSAAFDHILKAARELQADKTQKSRGAILLLVDEADALAQSREIEQMHHEDRAGVDAFIRGVDSLARSREPAAVIMCTNRAGSLDPAVRRRAAHILEFGRPDNKQRQQVLTPVLGELGFKDSDIESIVSVTGKGSEREYGFTFSDLTQRLLQDIILDAYPTGPVDPGRALEIARAMTPTPPFQEHE